MKSRPILFSSPMIRAILNGSKSQTRRVVKPQPGSCSARLQVGYTAFTRKGCISLRGDWMDVPGATGLPQVAMFGGPYEDGELRYGEWVIPLKYGAVRDRLWVRETFAVKWRESLDEPWEGFAYRADHPEGEPVPGNKWKPSIYMPRAASRLTLEITGIRCERLQEICLADARAEGIPQTAGEAVGLGLFDTRKEPGYEWDNRTSVENYARLWDSLNGTKPGAAWADDPFVWIVAFRRVPQSAAEGARE